MQVNACAEPASDDRRRLASRVTGTFVTGGTLLKQNRAGDRLFLQFREIVGTDGSSVHANGGSVGVYGTSVGVSGTLVGVAGSSVGVYGGSVGVAGRSVGFDENPVGVSGVFVGVYESLDGVGGSPVGTGTFVPHSGQTPLTLPVRS